MHSVTVNPSLSLSLNIRSTNQVILGTCLVLLSIVLFRILYANYDIDLSQLADTHKCPFCYGTFLCPNIVNGSIKSNSTLLNKLIYFINSKKTLYGQFDGRDILIKKLAYSSELSEFDKLVCNKFYGQGNSTECFDDVMNYYASINHLYNSVNASDKLLLCSNNSFPFVLKIFSQCSNSKNANPTLDELFMFWTKLKLNPEPLILQLLKAEEGWPVPKYYGSCGRLTIVEFCGTELKNFYYSPLKTRMHLASQILDLAYNFTFSHEKYAFYFTDISPINLVVDSNNTVKFIDLEHVIISEKNFNSEKIEDWDSIHSTQHIECRDCLAFSSKDICEHQISDHNFYAVCKDIFGNSTFMPEGLLHKPSKCLLKAKSNVSFLIQNCIEPTQNLTRFQIAANLKTLIAKCLNENHSEIQVNEETQPGLVSIWKNELRKLPGF